MKKIKQSELQNLITTIHKPNIFTHIKNFFDGMIQWFKKTVAKNLLLIGISVFFLGVSIFWIGFHNADLCQNFRYLESKANHVFAIHGVNQTFNIIEQRSDFKFWDLGTCYITGMNDLILGMMLTGAGGFLLGIEARKRYKYKLS